MNGIELTLLIFGMMLGLMALRVPIAISMFAAGSIGYVMQAGWLPLANFLCRIAEDHHEQEVADAQ